MSLVTVALFRAGRLFARATRVLNHLAAGTLRIADLRLGIESSWEHVYPGDANVGAGLLGWEEEVVARFVKPGDRMLLVGSGPGRDLIALAGKGYRVTGVEPVRRAIATARRQLETRGLSAEIIEGFFEDVALPDCFDVIMFSHGCYSFIPESRRRIAALRKAEAHLAAEGRILISYMTEQSGHPFLIWCARFAATLSGSDWRPERGDVLYPVDATLPLFHYQHPFRPGEIDSEASAAGLLVAHRCNFPDIAVVMLVRV